MDEIALDVREERFAGLARDAGDGSLYLFSDRSLYQMCTLDEERDAWRLCLETALSGDERKFEQARIAAYALYCVKMSK